MWAIARRAILHSPSITACVVHNYVGRNYVGNNCVDNNPAGHNLAGHSNLGHNYVGRSVGLKGDKLRGCGIVPYEHVNRHVHSHARNMRHRMPGR